MKNTLVIMMSVIVIAFSFSFSCSDALAADKANIAIESDSSYSLTNKEKRILKYGYFYDDSSFKGDMRVYWQNTSINSNDKKWRVFHGEAFSGDEFWNEKSGIVVDDSDEFCFAYEQENEDGVNEKKGMGITILMTSNKHPFVILDTGKVQRLVVGNRTMSITSYKNSNAWFHMDYRQKEKGVNYAVSGYTNSKFTFKKEKYGASLRGAVGKTTIEITDPKQKKSKSYSIGTYYFFGDKVKVYVKNGKQKVKGGIKASFKRHSKLRNVRLRTVNKGKDMFLTWDRVKGAKSYVVYRYDKSQKRYVRLTDRGEYSNYYQIRNVRKNEVQKFKIAARSKYYGDGKNVCRNSYAVWGINGKRAGNVGKVVTDKKRITGRKGQRTKLNAGVASGTKKPVLTTKVRWYSSDKKIAKVDKTTGEVRFLKKGKCYIWAKAHNGVNSKTIRVLVR